MYPRRPGAVATKPISGGDLRRHRACAREKAAALVDGLAGSGSPLARSLFAAAAPRPPDPMLRSMAMAAGTPADGVSERPGLQAVLRCAMLRGTIR